jgi:hypothetical protein
MPGWQATADMPNLFALMSDESDHPIAGDKLRGNDEGRTGGTPRQKGRRSGSRW